MRVQEEQIRNAAKIFEPFTERQKAKITEAFAALTFTIIWKSWRRSYTERKKKSFIRRASWAYLQSTNKQKHAITSCTSV